jgi:hypothetical protein
MQSGIAYLVAALIDYALHGTHCLITSGVHKQVHAIFLAIFGRRWRTVAALDHGLARPNVIEDLAITGFEFPANASIRRSRS